MSDVVQLAVGAGEPVAVTLYFDSATGPATFHAQAFAAGFRGAGCLLDEGGDEDEDEGGDGFTESSESWYFLSAVETDSGRRDGIALFGDSITDGFGSTPGADRRWSDALASRTGRPVLNAGIGGICCSTTPRGTGSGVWAGSGAMCFNWPGWTRSLCCWG